MIKECSVIISAGLCFGPSVLDDACLCCRPVGTSRIMGCVRTPAQAFIVMTPTCTSWFLIRMESTASGPPVSKAAHVRPTLTRSFFIFFYFRFFLPISVKLLILLDRYITLAYIDACIVAMSRQSR